MARQLVVLGTHEDSNNSANHKNNRHDNCHIECPISVLEVNQLSDEIGVNLTVRPFVS